ncbi:unnamed protein product [marine sediment metagenome]|uniref:Uncharacterized protein n=1 Tax=marine sediment metagenome TaxID=412755 RepID=X1AJ64_9ZZZZ
MFEKDTNGIGCSKHCAGTRILPSIGKVLLGVPKGFNRYGINEKTQMVIFENFVQQNQQYSYDKLNVPVWKYLEEDTCFVRGLLPRLNEPFLHIIGNITKEEFNSINCIEITKQDLEDMD